MCLQATANPPGTGSGVAAKHPGLPTTPPVARHVDLGPFDT
jgi:hypothetical protein